MDILPTFTARRTLTVLLLVAAAACEKGGGPPFAPARSPDEIGAGPASPAPPTGAVASGAAASPPAKPPGLQAYAVSESEVRITWNPSTDDRGVVTYEVLRGDSLAGSTRSLDAADVGLAPFQEFCYSVRAVDGAGNRSARAGPVCVRTPDRTPPSVPGAPQVELSSPTQAALTWPPSTDNVWVEGYEVRRGDALVATGAENTASEGGLEPGKEYCWSVRAFDKAGHRSAYSAPTCVLAPDVTPPSAPALPVATPSTPEGLTASAPGETAVVLRWRPSTDDVGVTGYEVLRGQVVVARATGPAAGEERLLPATAYCYQVRAVDAAGNRSPPSGESCVTTPDLTPPTVPPEVAAAPSSDRAVAVTWKPSTDNVGVTGYEVLRGDEVVARATATRASITGLAPGREYCHAVRARDAAGNPSPASPRACATARDLAPPTVPGAPVAAAVSAEQVALGWEPSTDDSGVAGYEVLRGNRSIARVAGPSATDGMLEAATEYCYRIRAFDTVGNLSQPSAEVCARTPEPGVPTAPTRLEAKSSWPRSVSLLWERSPDPDVVYAVFWEKGQRIGTTRFPFYKVDGLRPGEKRCFQVAAVNAAGKMSPLTWPVCASPGASAPTVEAPSIAAPTAGRGQGK